MPKQHGITQKMTPKLKEKVLSCFGNVKVKSIALMLNITYCQAYHVLIQEGFIESSSNRYRKDRRRNKNHIKLLTITNNN